MGFFLLVPGESTGVQCLLHTSAGLPIAMETWEGVNMKMDVTPRVCLTVESPGPFYKETQ